MTFGGGDSEFDSATAVATTSDGGLIVVGRTSPIDGFGSDLWIARMTAWGGVLWERAVGGVQHEDVADVLATEDGGCLVVGWTYSYGAGDADGWAVKFSSSGAVEWQRTYGGVGEDQFRAAALSPDGYYVGGVLTDPPTAPDAAGATGPDAWVLELDDAGNILWQERFAGDLTDGVRTLAATPDGVVFSADSNSDFGGHGGVFFFRPWAVCLDGDGGVLWQKTYNYSGGDTWSGVVPLDDGGFVMVGEILVTNFWGGDAWVVRLDEDGDVVWDRRFGDHFGVLDADSGAAVQPTADGGFSVIGSTLTTGAGSQDLWFLKLDANGALEWDATYGGPQFDQAEAMSLAPDGDLYLAGRLQFLPAEPPHVLVSRLRADGSVGPHCDLGSATAPNLWTDVLHVDPVTLAPQSTSIVPADSAAGVTILDRSAALCSPLSGGGARR
jgi:hypothetical protein